MALWGLGAAFLFVLVFSLVYLYFFRRDAFALKLFLISSGAILVLSFLKALISYFHRGYIYDRLFFYAVFSPKARGFFWLILLSLIFILFLKFREQLERLSALKFLFFIYFIFVTFSVSVASIREGFYGVYEPFTRAQWEYVGDLPLVKSASDFLNRYVSLEPFLAIHSRTHPPGYTLVLYFLQKYFHAGIPALSVLVVMLGGLTIFPLYYFLKNFASEEEARRGIQLFIFIPSVVMMSATSMETVFLFFVWASISLIYLGWRKGGAWPFLGGVALYTALFSNFLFILLAPLFLMLALIAYQQGAEFKKLVLRSALAVLGFSICYFFIYVWTGYSIVQNFFAARSFQSNFVENNFASLGVYLTYFFMNLTSFLIYLGVPTIFLFLKNLKNLFNKEKKILALGFIMSAFFLAAGIFQGETERIWLFLAPLFILPITNFIKTAELSSALISLFFFETIFMQIMFYTYW